MAWGYEVKIDESKCATCKRGCDFADLWLKCVVLDFGPYGKPRVNQDKMDKCKGFGCQLCVMQCERYGPDAITINYVNKETGEISASIGGGN